MTRLPDGREVATIADLAAEVIRHAETEAGDPFAVAQSGIALARAVLAEPSDPHLADARRFEGYLRAFSLGSEARHAGTVHDRPPTEMDEMTAAWWKQGREYTRRGLELDAVQEEGRRLHAAQVDAEKVAREALTHALSDIDSERLEDPQDCEEDRAYDCAVRHCSDAVRLMRESPSDIAAIIEAARKAP